MKMGRMTVKIVALVALLVLVSLFARSGIEFLVSDAATRLAHDIRDQAMKLRVSGSTIRTFEHHPRPWPKGLSGDYRIEIVETPASPKPGHRSIGIARTTTGSARYSTSYHLNFVSVPQDLIVTHRSGEPTRVTLELRKGRVEITALR